MGGCYIRSTNFFKKTMAQSSPQPGLAPSRGSYIPVGRRVAISKMLCYLLRHTDSIDADGFINLRRLLGLRQCAGISEQHVRTVVASCPLKRFEIEETSEGPFIKATYAHSKSNDENDLTLVDPEDVEMVIYPTFRKNLAEIEELGISWKRKNHFILSQSFPPHKDHQTEANIDPEKSFACEVCIILDHEAFMRDGHSLFKCPNDIFLLTKGNERGVIEPKYFKEIKHEW